MIKPTMARFSRTSAEEGITAGFLFVAPAFIGFLLFYFLPTLRAIAISLTDWNLMRAPRFIGLYNYVRLSETVELESALPEQGAL